jgi:dihydrofolate reductase
MTDFLLSAVVAASENNVIGRDNDLPWRLSNDLKWFKSTTMNKPIVMGRKTFQSLPGMLPGRTHIVITRDPGFTAEGAVVTQSLEAAIESGKRDAATRGETEIMIIGGAEIFHQSLDRLDRIYLTRVHAEVDGDTFLPALDPANWREDFREFHEKSEKDAFDHSFMILNRIHK